MKNGPGKPLHIEPDERGCTSPLYKEIRLNEGSESNRIYLSSPLIESEASGYTMSTESRMTEESAGASAKLREKYYEFANATKKLYISVDAYFNQLKKNLNIKMNRILTPDELISYFEKIHTKVQVNQRQSRKNWNEEETFLLVSLISYYCLLRDEDYNCLSEDVWEFLGSIYPGKKADRLQHRWQSIFKVTLSKIPWTPTEDQLLVKIVQEKSAQKPWKEVALELYSKSGLGIYRQGRQCRERWVNHLDPSINRGYWTTEEDINLLKSYLELGCKWSEIAKKLRNRTENTVKNRWKSLMKRFKSMVCLDNLNNMPTQQAEREEKLEQLIAQAVLNCYERGILTKVPTKAEGTKQRRKPRDFTRDQSSPPQRSPEGGLRAKIDASDKVIVEEKNPYDFQVISKPPRKKTNPPQLIETEGDNLSKNLRSGELIDKPIRYAERSTGPSELKKAYSQNYSTPLFKFEGGFSSANNSYMDSNSSRTFQGSGLNNSFDYIYLAGGSRQPNSALLYQSTNPSNPLFRRSQDDFFVSKKGTGEEEDIGTIYGLTRPLFPGEEMQTPQKPSQTLSTGNDSNGTPIPIIKNNSTPQEEMNPDLFVNYENENKSDSMNMDVLDFFSSEIESNSEFSGFHRTNNMNDLLFGGGKLDFRTRAKSERDPTEHLSTEGGYGHAYGSEIVKNNNRGVRKSSLDLLLESSTLIDGQEAEEKEMNLHLKRFSEFKPDEYFKKQSGNCIFYALVDTSKNELFLVDPITKDNYFPAINAMKTKKPVHKPSIFEGLDLARHLPQDNMKNLKNQFSNFNLT